MRSKLGTKSNHGPRTLPKRGIGWKWTTQNDWPDKKIFVENSFCVIVVNGWISFSSRAPHTVDKSKLGTSMLDSVARYPLVFNNMYLDARPRSPVFENRGCHDQWIVFEILAVCHFGVTTFSTCVEVTCETVKSIRTIILNQRSFRPTVCVFATKVRGAHVGRPNS